MTPHVHANTLTVFNNAKLHLSPIICLTQTYHKLTSSTDRPTDLPTALQAVVQVAGDTGYLIYSCSLPVTSVTDWQAATSYNRLNNILLSRAEKLKEENVTFFLRIL
jgi:hypothetical protein